MLDRARMHAAPAELSRVPGGRRLCYRNAAPDGVGAAVTRHWPLGTTAGRGYSYSKLVAAPTFEASHFSNACCSSTTRIPEDIA